MEKTLDPLLFLIILVTIPRDLKTPRMELGENKMKTPSFFYL